MQSEPHPRAPQTESNRGASAEVLGAFLRLGLTSFGGPVAHLGYFRAEFVERRAWLSDARFAELLALSQFLPGPASSQLAFAIGMQRAGWLGGLAAFVGFTLPSALLMFALAVAGASLGGAWWTATVHGLKLLAVAVVADGLWKMARQLTPDAARLAVAAVAAALVIWVGSADAQLVALALGAAAGLLLPSGGPAGPESYTPTAPRAGVTGLATSIVAVVAFVAVLAVALSQRGGDASLTALAAAFARAGSLVFGGGHVVLPLLEESVVASGWLSSDTFLTGYGAAQAVPGPMFSLAAYLGASTPWTSGPVGLGTQAIGASVALLAVFIPGFLLVAAALPMWSRITANATARRAIIGVNAAVVGLLAAAFYDPVFSSGVQSPVDAGVALVGVALFLRMKRPALWVLLWCVGAAMLLALQ